MTKATGASVNDWVAADYQAAAIENLDVARNALRRGFVKSALEATEHAQRQLVVMQYLSGPVLNIEHVEHRPTIDLQPAGDAQ